MAIERLEGTLKWRREFGVYELTAEQVEPEVSEGCIFWFCFGFAKARFLLTLFCFVHLSLSVGVLFVWIQCVDDTQAVTGKVVAFGYDTLRRPALYMMPSRQNTEESPRQIQYTVWFLERALDLTGPGVE